MFNVHVVSAGQNVLLCPPSRLQVGTSACATAGSRNTGDGSCGRSLCGGTVWCSWRRQAAVQQKAQQQERQQRGQQLQEQERRLRCRLVHHHDWFQHDRFVFF